MPNIEELGVEIVSQEQKLNCSNSLNDSDVY